MIPKRNPGPFLKSFFISDPQIEATAKLQLETLKLMPSAPGPVAVEKYCDRRWGFPEDYIDLPPGVLGCASFSESGLAGIAISRELCEDISRIGIVRTRSTGLVTIFRSVFSEVSLSVLGGLLGCRFSSERGKIIQ